MTVELRPWTAEDAPALVAAYRDTPDLHTQFGGADLSMTEDAREYIGQQFINTGASRHRAVTIGGVVVGNVGLTGIERRHGTAWASYWLTSAARGRGCASRALATITDEAFDDGIFRIELGHRVNNPESCAVATRAGFVAEGVERQKLRYGTQRFDVETHARLRTDPRPDVAPLPIVG